MDNGLLPSATSAMTHLIQKDITEINSGCMQYQNLQIRDIVNQTPRDTGSDHVALRGVVSV